MVTILKDMGPQKTSHISSIGSQAQGLARK